MRTIDIESILHLTTDERMVLEAVWQSMDRPDAALHLNMPLELLEAHLNNAREKLDAGSDWLAVCIYMRNVCP